jgi:competence protein ComEA
MELPAVSRGRALVFAAAAVSLLALGGQLLLRDGGGGPAAAGTRPAALVAQPAPPPALLVVHVAGAVRHPGLYRLREGSRVDDALRAAGGPLAKAATDLVNLAAQVADGQQIVVPRRDALPGGAAAAGGPGGAAADAPAGPVHLNTATLAELDTLPGVGPATAQKIADYREQHGGFRSIDELDAVPGIGPARLAELRPLVAP